MGRGRSEPPSRAVLSFAELAPDEILAYFKRVQQAFYAEQTDITRLDNLLELAKEFEDCGVAAINFTDIHRDGMQTGPNLEATRRLAEAVSIICRKLVSVSVASTLRNMSLPPRHNSMMRG